MAALLKGKYLTRQKLADLSGRSLRTVYAAVKGERVSQGVAAAISAALGCKPEKLFSLEGSERTLSGKTVRE